MAKFQVQCPHHLRVETIDVPDTHKETGFYEVSCGSATDKKKVRVRLFVSGKVKSIIGVERADAPFKQPSYGQK